MRVVFPELLEMSHLGSVACVTARISRGMRKPVLEGLSELYKAATWLRFAV